MKNQILLTVLAALPFVTCGGCGGGGSDDGQPMPGSTISVGEYSGSTSYTILNDGDDRALCERGLNRLYREDPLVFIVSTIDANNLSFRKGGKGGDSAVISPGTSEFSYDEAFASQEIPESAGESCSFTATYDVVSVDDDLISVRGLQHYSCTSASITTVCDTDFAADMSRTK